MQNKKSRSLSACGLSAIAVIMSASGQSLGSDLECDDCLVCSTSVFAATFFVDAPNEIDCCTAYAFVSASAMTLDEYTCSGYPPVEFQKDPGYLHPFLYRGNTQSATLDGQCGRVYASASVQGNDGYAQAKAFAAIQPWYALYSLSAEHGLDCTSSCWTGLAASASSSAKIRFDLVDPMDTVSTCITFPQVDKDNVLDGIYLQFVDSDCGCGWVAYSADGELPSSALTVDSNGNYQLCCELDASVGIDFNANIYAGQLSQLDYDGDGRLTQGDVFALSNLILQHQPLTPMNPECGEDISDIVGHIYDLNGDGSVDYCDDAFLQSILDCGFDTGIFGDANGDGVVDCADESAQNAFPLQIGMGSSPNSVYLGDTDYLFQLDHNLDGVLDATDEAAFNALFASCP